MSEIEANGNYRSVCDCGWSYESDDAAVVREEALKHFEHARGDASEQIHHPTQPRKVDLGNDQ